MTFTRSALALAGILAFAGAANAEVFIAGPGLDIDLPDDDPAGITVPLAVEFGEAVETVTVAVAMDHTWVGDLIMTVTSPAGTTVTLMDRPGEPDQGGFGDSSDLADADGQRLGFDDRFVTPSEAAGSDCDASPTDTLGDGCRRAFSPSMPLAMFNGESATGEWVLTITDNAGGDTGQLDGWLIAINNAE